MFSEMLINTIQLLENILMPYKNIEDKRANQRRYYQRHRDEILKKQSESFKKRYPEIKDKVKTWNKQWRENNKEYNKQRVKTWLQNNPNKKSEYDKKYYDKNKETLLTKNKIIQKEWRQNLSPTRRRIIVERFRGYQKKFYYKRKEQLFHILGHVCIRCGEFDKRCLQVDHKNGGGRRELLRLGGSRALVRYYYKNPKEAIEKLQILCANCNIRKVYENDESNYRKHTKLLDQINKKEL